MILLPKKGSPKAALVTLLKAFPGSEVLHHQGKQQQQHPGTECTTAIAVTRPWF